MRVWQVAALSALGVAVLGGASWARDIFVSPRGSDASPGTVDRPLATLRQACLTANPGDVICLRAGSYPEPVYWDQGGNGAPGAPISIRACDGDRTARTGPITLHNRQHISISGLDISGGGNALHIDGGSHHVYVRRCYVHDAGASGDCIKVNQCDYIFIEDNEVARPGKRADGVTYQEGIDFVDVDFSAMRGNYLHDFGDMALYTKGGSEHTLIEGNVISHQLNRDLNPATGFGQGCYPIGLMDGATYQSYHCVFRNNIIRDCPGGAVGTYDAYHAYFCHNLVHNCGDIETGQPIVHQRTSSTFGEDGKTAGAYFFNNIFLDTRGEMPTVYGFRSGKLEGWRSSHNNYYNAGRPIPSAGFADPNRERGATLEDPGLAEPTGEATDRSGWLALYAITAESRALIDRGDEQAGERPAPRVERDVMGVPRPQGAGWDIGPFEWRGELGVSPETP